MALMFIHCFQFLVSRERCRPLWGGIIYYAYKGERRTVGRVSELSHIPIPGVSSCYQFGQAGTMAVRPTLPYFAPAELLPAPLPTVAEILASETFLVRYGEAPIVRVGDHYVVKYGKKEYIPGKLLDQLWDKLSCSEKTNITWQLRRNMHELRSIPSPGYYGGIWKQPALDCSFRGLDPEYSAAQETEEFWAYGLWRCLDLKLKGASRNVLPALWGIYQTMFKGHEAVFTHGNLFPGNIMFNEDTGTVVIINWEFSGWYPSFWEYCCAMLLLQYRYEWALWVPAVLDEYVAELGWIQNYRELMLQS
ncbi:hypothetical protein B0I37DRAFT_116541 [Chaetomium sp. MPI-CAGE-AT-0009]|nr:hypothetical protein B0I37DRAFT_116541 [Chaetomium sp. MPI-CAGE-AT-0009]